MHLDDRQNINFQWKIDAFCCCSSTATWNIRLAKKAKNPEEKILAIVLFILCSLIQVSQLPSQRDREQIVHFLAFHILHGTLLRNYAILQILQILHASAICKTPSPRL